MISKEEMLSRIVEPIREAMAKGDLLWLRGWNKGAGGGLNFNPSKAGDPEYTGAVNNLLMWIAAATRGYGDPRWMTYRQAKKRGWKLLPGEWDKGGQEVYRPQMGWYTDKQDGNKRKPFVKGWHVYSVFNAQQFDGIPPMETLEDLDTVTGYERAEAFYAALDVETTHAGNQAKYSPSLDMITMPPTGLFTDTDEYHAVRLHEIGHSTGHKSRLDRGLFGEGMAAYAQEELVAELFSAFACAHLGIQKEGMTQNHAAYLQSWHRRLGEKPQLFLDAVNAAWKALAWAREQDPSPTHGE